MNIYPKHHRIPNRSDETQRNHKDSPQANPIRKMGNDEVKHRGPDINGHSEQLRFDRVIAKGLDDGRQEGAKSKRADVHGNLVQRRQPALWIPQRFPHFLDIEWVCVGVLGGGLHSQSHEFSVFLVEEVCCLEVVGEEEECGDSGGGAH